MNSPFNTRAPTTPASACSFAAFEDAFSKIESSAFDARNMASIASHLAESVPGPDDDKNVVISAEIAQLLTFAVYQTERMVKDISADWLAAHAIRIKLPEVDQ